MNRISRQTLTQRLCCLDGSELLYINNAKAACSTIKKAMWLSADAASFTPKTSPHDKVTGPFTSTLPALQRARKGLQSSKIFTVVRNPYQRVVSAYLDKVAPPAEGRIRDHKVWTIIAQRYGFELTREVSLVEMLRCLAQDDPWAIDQHFAPQWATTLVDYVNYDFAGHLEDMSLLWPFLAQHGVEMAEHRSHATGASGKVAAILGPEERALVEQIYGRDFAIFGYAMDPAQIAPDRAMALPPATRQSLAALIRAYNAPNKKQCRIQLQRLSEHLPAHDSLYSRLDYGPLGRNELTELYAAFRDGKIEGWKTLLKLSQQLAGTEMVLQAAEVMDQARRAAGG